MHIVCEILAPYGLSTLEQARATMPPHQYDAIVRQAQAQGQAQTQSLCPPGETMTPVLAPLALAVAPLAPATASSAASVVASAAPVVASAGSERPARRARLIERLAPVTLLLLIVMALYFLVESLQPGGSQSIDTLYAMGATTPDTLRDGQLWRLVVSCFLHIGIVHLGGNAIALFWLGRMAERLYGPLRYLGIYLAAGLGGALLTVWTAPSALEAGASGAIWGIMGALLVGSWRNKDVAGRISGREIRQSIIAVVVINAITSFSPGVSLSAHFGGCLTGCVLALCIPFISPRENRAITIACRAASASVVVAAAALVVTTLPL